MWWKLYFDSISILCQILHEKNNFTNLNSRAHTILYRIIFILRCKLRCTSHPLHLAFINGVGLPYLNECSDRSIGSETFRPYRKLSQTNRPTDREGFIGKFHFQAILYVCTCIKCNECIKNLIWCWFFYFSASLKHAFVLRIMFSDESSPLPAGSLFERKRLRLWSIYENLFPTFNR